MITFNDERFPHRYWNDEKMESGKCASLNKNSTQVTNGQ